MWVISLKMYPKCEIGGQISKLLYHYLFYVIRALGNAELRVLVRTFFPWDA